MKSSLGPLSAAAWSYVLLATVPIGAPIGASVPGTVPTAPIREPVAALWETLEPTLRDLVADALARDPEIERLRHVAAAAAARAPQARSLPDPTLALTWFALPPETRVGPQRLSISARQAVPWLGTLRAKERRALWLATAAEAEVAARRLEVLTEVRRLAVELAFLDQQDEILRTERSTLSRFEEAAQARYAVGDGLQQEVIRIQTRLTDVERTLLELSARRVSLLASLNALRDRPPATPAPSIASLMRPSKVQLDQVRLDQVQLDQVQLDQVQPGDLGPRPELAAARARVAAAEAAVEIASLGSRPGVELGASYTQVEPRGGASAPADDGDDVFALTAGLRLPVWRQRLEAALEEAQAERRAADSALRSIVASITSEVGDLRARLPLLEEQERLLERVLTVQARETLRSAESAYTTGRLNAVDLLDAEVLQLEVQIGLARTRADLAIARVHLEAALARPLPAHPPEAPR